MDQRKMETTMMSDIEYILPDMEKLDMDDSFLKGSFVDRSETQPGKA